MGVRVCEKGGRESVCVPVLVYLCVLCVRVCVLACVGKACSVLVHTATVWVLDLLLGGTPRPTHVHELTCAFLSLAVQQSTDFFSTAITETHHVRSLTIRSCRVYVPNRNFPSFSRMCSSERIDF